MNNVPTTPDTEAPTIQTGPGVISFPRTTGKQILHIEVGNKDWTPTEKELQVIAEHFQRVDLTGGYVVTRDGIRVTVID